MNDDNWRFFRWKPWRDWPANMTEEKWRQRDNEFAREMWGKRLGFLFLFRCKKCISVKEIKHFSNIWVRSNGGKTQITVAKMEPKTINVAKLKKNGAKMFYAIFFFVKNCFTLLWKNLTFNLTQCKSTLVTMNYKSYIITYNP